LCKKAFLELAPFVNQSICRFKSIKSNESAMFVRSCEEDDINDLFAWRNDPVTREMSLNTDPVSKVAHEKWFAQKQQDTNCFLYIGEKVGEKVGVVRFDYDPYRMLAEVSINLNPLLRGKKISSPLLLSSVEAFREVRLCPIFALVRVENVASRKLFKASGFCEQKFANGVCEFILSR
jgi:L-amino acid N-acyltransferase YncA